MTSFAANYWKISILLLGGMEPSAIPWIKGIIQWRDKWECHSPQTNARLFSSVRTQKRGVVCVGGGRGRGAGGAGRRDERGPSPLLPDVAHVLLSHSEHTSKDQVGLLGNFNFTLVFVLFFYCISVSVSRSPFPVLNLSYFLFKL